MVKKEPLPGDGLTSAEAKSRLEKYGLNELKRTEKVSPLKILVSQFISPLILILIGAAIVSILLENVIDTILILSIVFASGILGFFQDYKAERTIEALRKMATPKSHVLREGKRLEILSTEIVPGDVIFIEAGDVIPADAKILESNNLRVDESSLTGESKSVDKKVSDEIYMNTSVFVGTAKALVIGTGMKSKMGEIADKLQKIAEDKSPFQVEMEKLSQKIFWLVLLIVIFIFLFGLLRYQVHPALLLALSLAVAAIPEGLHAVITLALAMGANVMAKKNALIRKLSVTESIGSIDVICTDKTGTITKNEMTVTEMYVNDCVYYSDKLDKKQIKEIELMLLCGSLCNDATLVYDSKGNNKYVGDQTEVAIRKLSDKNGIVKEDLKFQRIGEEAFTSSRKMMSVLCKKHGKFFVFAKGAPEVLLKRCTHYLVNGKIIKFDKKKRDLILAENHKFASNALRVLGFAYKEEKKSDYYSEDKFIWLGLEAMIDPPRDAVREAVMDCKTAGIRIVMLTGDSPITAKAISDKVFIESKGVVLGEEVEKMKEFELEKALNSGVNIFARVNPFDKLRILKILQKENRIAMTGDGVNDALALKKADVGIAMAIRGTEVSKEASDIILLDDNFATIKAAIQEGRRIFDNIRKFVVYLFVCNFAEVAVLFLATVFLTLKEPILLPVHLLWINLLTDGLPAIALGVDPATYDVMKKPPREKGDSIMNNQLLAIVVSMGSLLTIILFMTYFLTLEMGLELARTTLFTGFILYEFVKIANIRYREKMSVFSNKWVMLAILGSVLMQVSLLYTPLGQYFSVVPLGLYEWGILVFGMGLFYITTLLATKIILRVVKD